MLVHACVPCSQQQDQQALAEDINRILQLINNDIYTGFTYETYVDTLGAHSVVPPPELQIVPAAIGCLDGTVPAPNNTGCCQSSAFYIAYSMYHIACTI